MQIITVDGPLKEVLRKKTEDIQENEFPLAQEIAEKLLQALKPYSPAAGLAAPQIGISKSVFIFSFDRNPENLEAVINPSFVPVNEKTTESWEGCLSVLLSESCWKFAKIPRYEAIKVTYFNLKGSKVEKVLEQFAAKVFQHEYDHLQGIVNIDRADAIVKSFNQKEDMLNFIQEIKKEDASHYKKPA